MRASLLVSFLFVTIFSFCQDGKIIDRVPYTVPDTTLTRIEKIVPGIKAVAKQIELYRITYMSDGLKVKGYMALPKKSGKFPAVIFNRGGNREFAAINDVSFLRLVGNITAAGYVVVASQYRGNAGGEGLEEFGGKDVNDVLNLIPLLNNVPKADTSRIGMFGWSRGGMMTYLTLTRTTKIKAAVVGSGLADLFKAIESRPEFDTLWQDFIPNYTTDKQKVLEQRSATYLVDKINKQTPILILQGSADWRVPSNQVLDLVNKLYLAQQPFRFIFYEGGEHSLIEHRSDYVQQIINWFNMYLRDGKKWPSLEPHGQ